MPPGVAWRLFVAVPANDAIRSVLAPAVELLRQERGADDWSWSDPAGWHVTLAFLGATDPARVPSVTAALSDVAQAASPFTLSSDRWGAFPRPRSARVIWYGFDDRERRLAQVAGRVRAALGLPADDRFRAHLTIARARTHPGSDVRRIVSSLSAPPSFLTVEAVALVRSHVGRGPARYETLAGLPFGGAA